LFPYVHIPYICRDQLTTLRISPSRLFFRRIEAVGQKLATSREWKTIRSLPEIENCQNSPSLSLCFSFYPLVFLNSAVRIRWAVRSTLLQIGSYYSASKVGFGNVMLEGGGYNCCQDHHPDTVFVNV
jgi:hypothetical protein